MESGNSNSSQARKRPRILGPKGMSVLSNGSHDVVPISSPKTTSTGPAFSPSERAKQLRNPEYQLSSSDIDETLFLFTHLNSHDTYISQSSWYRPKDQINVTHLHHATRDFPDWANTWFIPLCKRHHWYLTIVNVQERVIEMYESFLRADLDLEIKSFVLLLVDSALPKIQKSEWSIRMASELDGHVRQGNAFDCGLHILRVAIGRLMGLRVPRDMSALSRELVASILGDCLPLVAAPIGTTDDFSATATSWDCNCTKLDNHAIAVERWTSEASFWLQAFRRIEKIFESESEALSDVECDKWIEKWHNFQEENKLFVPSVPSDAILRYCDLLKRRRIRKAARIEQLRPAVQQLHSSLATALEELDQKVSCCESNIAEAERLIAHTREQVQALKNSLSPSLGSIHSTIGL